MVLETYIYGGRCERAVFSQQKKIRPKNWENGPKMGQEEGF